MSNIIQALEPVKDDLKELAKIGFTSLVFTLPFHLVFREWALTIIFYTILYSTFLNSAYIVSIDKKLKLKL